MLNTANLRMARRLNAFRHKYFYMPKYSVGLLIWWLAVSMLALYLIVAYKPSVASANGIIETASWYGGISDHTDIWPHVRTANGEKYVPSAFTAASWQYPFGTILMVMNTNNGKAVLVRVNDRGPSKRLVSKGRIIDLSQAAFSKIADLKTGVIPVKVTKI